MEKFAVLGLGYVGLPLALSLSKKYKVVGFDNNKIRINDLNNGKDINNEFSRKELKKQNILFTCNDKDLKNCEIFFLTIPTPINNKNIPDLSLVKKATKLVGKYLKKNCIVVYESTVYPGTTEEICGPLLEKISKLKYNIDFFCSYSPERINPGDKVNNINNIVKLVSSSSKNSLKRVSKIYKSIIKSKVYSCSSIKVAEAAKIIENTQRDINISLMNEFSIICRKLNISVHDVLDAASTKWNFVNFKPGLVGGHCIGVDPYYLTYKAKKIGIDPKVILAGRKVNDGMANYFSNYFLNNLKKKKIKKKSKVLILGATFKENISDIRNSKILEIGKILKSKGCNVDFYDPHVVKLPKNFNLVEKPKSGYYNAIIVGVKHQKFKKLGIEKIKKFAKNKNYLIFDLQNLFQKEFSNKITI